MQVDEGPFRGGLFELSIEFPFDYPVGSPVIKFVMNNNNHEKTKNAKGRSKRDNGVSESPITHPNVDEDGRGECAVEDEQEQQEEALRIFLFSDTKNLFDIALKLLWTKTCLTFARSYYTSLL